MRSRQPNVKPTPQFKLITRPRVVPASSWILLFVKSRWTKCRLFSNMNSKNHNVQSNIGFYFSLSILPSSGGWSCTCCADLLLWLVILNDFSRLTNHKRSWAQDLGTIKIITLQKKVNKPGNELSSLLAKVNSRSCRFDLKIFGSTLLIAQYWRSIP